MTHNVSGAPAHAVVFVAGVVRDLDNLRAHRTCLERSHHHKQFLGKAWPSAVLGTGQNSVAHRDAEWIQRWLNRMRSRILSMWLAV